MVTEPATEIDARFSGPDALATEWGVTQAELAAAELFCHRHTLRYRLRRVELLTGRDLASTRDRIEFWLALRGRELAR